MVQPYRYVEAPPVTPLRYGLLDAAVVVDNPDPHIGFGIEYEPEGCDIVYSTLGACLAATGTSTKTSNDGFPLVTADAFAVYNLVRCRTVGAIDKGRDRAVNGLRLGEGRAVETEVAAHFADFDDLTPSGTPVDMVDGLAILEEYAASVYGGVPVIHMARGMGTRLAARYAIQRGSRTLETMQGALVASGGGYVDPVGPTAAADGATWMFATGTVLVQRNPEIGTPDRSILAIGAGEDGGSNEFFALAERPYAVAWECFQVAVQVVGSGCCGTGGGGGGDIDGGSP